MADHKKKKDHHANQAQPPPAGAWHEEAGAINSEHPTWREEAGAVNSEHQKMLEWLKKVRFKKTLFGGVSESDVWRKMEELNRLYEAALIAERARYEALLEAQINSLSRDRPEAHQNHGNAPEGLTGNMSEKFSEGSGEDTQSEFPADDDIKGA